MEKEIKSLTENNSKKEEGLISSSGKWSAKNRTFRLGFYRQKMPYTWSITVLILVVALLNFYWNSIPFSLNQIDFATLFGATSRNLLFGARQWWRWITWPFFHYSLFQLIFSVIFFWNISPLFEMMYGSKKAFFISFFSVLSTAVVQSMLDFKGIMSGSWLLAAIITGSCLSYVVNKGSRLGVMNRYVTGAIVSSVIQLFVVSTFFFFEEQQLAAFSQRLLWLLTAVFCGYLVSEAAECRYSVNFLFIYVFGLILVVIFNLSYQYVYIDYENVTMNVLKFYRKNGWGITEDFIRNVQEKYFYFENN